MTEASGETFQIVLQEVAGENRPAAALFLSGCFSFHPKYTRKIVDSAPIALLARLGRAQAEAILAEMRSSLPGGIELSLVPSGDDSVGRLDWSTRVPRIFGRDLKDFPPGETIKCPFCGGMLRLTREGSAVKASRDTRVTGPFRPAPAGSDADPLFSGVEPLPTAGSDHASVRALQGGDTGFWLDTRGEFSSFPLPHELPQPSASGGDTPVVKQARATGGLAAHMKQGIFAVVVSRTRDAQAVKMIAEVMGISEAEARDKCLNLSLTIARDISLEDAQSLLARLRNLGAKARIARPA